MLKFQRHMEPGGNSYHVMINKYYNGSLMKAYDGWRVYLHPTTILQGDDVSVIIDLIEQNLNRARQAALEHSNSTLAP